MKKNIQLKKDLLPILRCPICKSKVAMVGEDYIKCSNYECTASFPVINDVPVLINEPESIFRIQDFTLKKDTYVLGELRAHWLGKFLPTLSQNLKSKANYARFVEHLLAQTSNPKVLIIGGGIVGIGLNNALDHPDITFIESDVAFGPRTTLICDAHDIPFEDMVFDGVIAQAVLEHVVDPARCVQEMFRVLTKQGLVYAETPFMQQVHGGIYDFTRFTHLGHRHLFKQFDEIDSGMQNGPGMALAWSYEYFLLSFVEAPFMRKLVRLFARLTAFWLKYFDYLLVDKRSAFDAASGLYFLGRKSDHILSHRDLIRLYRGAL